MILGFDIDGTITDFDGIMRELWKKYRGYEHTAYDENVYSLPKKFGIERKEVREFLGEVEYDFVHAAFDPVAVETLQILRNTGHTTHLITARGAYDDGLYSNRVDEFKRETARALHLQGVPYDHLHFGVKDKAKLAKKLGIELFFEDAVHQYKLLTEAVPTYVVAKGYNEEVPEDYRLNSIRDALKLVY